MTCILEGADTHQVAAFFSMLKLRSETVDEIVGMVLAIEKRAEKLHLPCPVLDIVGTGGDLAHTVNISTGAAIVAAGCGIPIAKHGNRSISSRSGSADVLEAFGIGDQNSARTALEHADGFVVGSSFVQLMGKRAHPSELKILAQTIDPRVMHA